MVSYLCSHDRRLLRTLQHNGKVHPYTLIVDQNIWGHYISVVTLVCLNLITTGKLNYFIEMMDIEAHHMATLCNGTLLDIKSASHKVYTHNTTCSFQKVSDNQRPKELLQSILIFSILYNPLWCFLVKIIFRFP